MTHEIKHGTINTGRAIHAISVGGPLGTYPICGSGGSFRHNVRITFTTAPLTCKWCMGGEARALAENRTDGEAAA